jgi:hypothetical protein
MKKLILFAILLVYTYTLKLTTFESALNSGAIKDTKSHDILKILKLDKQNTEDDDIREEDLLKHKSNKF